MILLKEERSREICWHETHLTARTGWVGGLVRSAGSKFEYEIFPPPDRLLTVRLFEKMPDDPKERPYTWCEIQWVSKDTRSVNKAQRQWGSLPRYLPALSQIDAEKHRRLPLINDMCLPPARRARVPRSRLARY